MNQPLPRVPPPDWRQYMLRAVIWVAFIAALGYSAANGGLDFLENDVVLLLEPNRDSIQVASTAPAVIEVKTTLRNSTSAEVELNALSACKVFRWQVFARSGDMVQSKVNEDSCPTTPVKAFLPAGKKIEEFYSIVLAAHRFKAGQDYLVHVWYWGHEAEFEFKAE